MWTIRTKIDDADGQTFRLMPGAVKTMGRAVRADFILDAPLVSRLHCRFTSAEDGSLVVEDLRSTNGTYVNGHRVERSVLGDGDRVRVGRVELTVVKDALRSGAATATATAR
jgi:ABC transport system ATP-binding/permease protein